MRLRPGRRVREETTGWIITAIKAGVIAQRLGAVQNKRRKIYGHSDNQKELHRKNAGHLFSVRPDKLLHLSGYDLDAPDDRLIVASSRGAGRVAAALSLLEHEGHALLSGDPLVFLYAGGEAGSGKCSTAHNDGEPCRQP